MAEDTRRFRVTIGPSRAGGLSVYINEVGEEFRDDTDAYLNALASWNASTRWGARRWARRQVKQLAKRRPGNIEVFEIEASA